MNKTELVWNSLSRKTKFASNMKLAISRPGTVVSVPSWVWRGERSRCATSQSDDDSRGEGWVPGLHSQAGETLVIISPTMPLYNLFLVVTLTVIKLSSALLPSSPAYYIQTDEGPNRFFQFSSGPGGQFRRETLLPNGTVVGVYSWRDERGMTRVYSYTADSRGYRVIQGRRTSRNWARSFDQFVKIFKSLFLGYYSTLTTSFSTTFSILPVIQIKVTMISVMTSIIR